MLLESWRSFEQDVGSESTQERVAKLMPERVKKRRKLQAEDGVRLHCVIVFYLVTRATILQCFCLIGSIWF